MTSLGLMPQLSRVQTENLPEFAMAVQDISRRKVQNYIFKINQAINREQDDAPFPVASSARADDPFRQVTTQE